MRRSIYSCLACLIAFTAAPAAAADRAELAAAVQSITTDDLERHVEALADDSFEGREAGARGGRAAGVYLAREFERHVLAGGAADGGYFQPFGSGYRNILAVLEGSDAELASEVILVGAHYDHVGYGTYQNSYGPTGYIHNGADDNGSGTAVVVELVEAFGQLSTRPKRTILFALWDAEEKGLLGSKHWVAQPTVPLDRLRLAINMDMVGRLRNEQLEVSGSRTALNLRRLVTLSHRDPALQHDFNWEVQDNSDHYSFYSRQIPFLMMHTGLHDQYHRPSDDAHLINGDGMTRVARLMFGVVNELADADTLGGFRAAARREQPIDARHLEAPLPPLPSRLGIRWNPQVEQIDGVAITAILPGSSAAQAELKPGERIVAVNGTPTVNAEALRRAIITAPVESTLTIVRPDADEPADVAITLTGEPLRVGIAWRQDAAEPQSLVLARVVPGSPAGDAGLSVGDRVYELNGESFDNAEQFLERITATEGSVSLLVEREGQLRTVEFDLPPAQ